METPKLKLRNHGKHYIELLKLRRPATDGFEIINLCLTAMVEKSMNALAETEIAADALSKIKSLLGPKEFSVWCNEHIKAKTVTVDTLLRMRKLQQRWVQSGNSDRETAYRLLGVLMLPDRKTERARHI